jgi:hypothetical protein
LAYGKLLDKTDDVRLCVRFEDGRVILAGRITPFTETAVSLMPTIGISPEFVVWQPDT